MADTTTKTEKELVSDLTFSHQILTGQIMSLQRQVEAFNKIGRTETAVAIMGIANNELKFLAENPNFQVELTNEEKVAIQRRNSRPTQQ
jgi:hypothetical protein